MPRFCKDQTFSILSFIIYLKERKLHNNKVKRVSIVDSQGYSVHFATHKRLVDLIAKTRRYLASNLSCNPCICTFELNETTGEIHASA